MLVAAWSVRRHPVALGGAGLAATMLVGLDRAIAQTGPWPVGPDRVPPGLLIGLAGLLIAGVVGEHIGYWWAGMLAAVPGALALAQWGDLEGASWIPWVVGASTVLGGATVEDLERRWGDSGLPAILLLISAIGVFYCVPDTDEACVLLGACIAIAAVSFPLTAARLGPGGGFVAVAMLAWTAGAGGVGRESSVVGSIGCLGILVAEPALPRRPRRRPHTRTGGQLTVVIAHRSRRWWCRPRGRPARHRATRGRAIAAAAAIAAGTRIARLPPPPATATRR